MVNWLKKNYLVCFLLGNSPASELPTRKHTSYRTRRKFERVHVTNLQMFILLYCDFYIPTVAWKCTNIVTVIGIVTEVFVL
jgi:hypothetical protein